MKRPPGVRPRPRHWRWAGEGALQPATGGRHGAKPEVGRSQCRPGARPRRRAAWERDSRAARRSFGSSPSRVIDTAVPFAAAMSATGLAATGKHFPGSGPRARTPTSRSSESDWRRSRLRRVDERPYRDLVASDGDMVMISAAIYIHFSHRPAAFTKRHRHRRASRPAGLHRGLDQRRARDRLRPPVRRAGEGWARGGAEPAPTCFCTRTTVRRRRRASRSGTACGPGVYPAPGSSGPSSAS